MPRQVDHIVQTLTQKDILPGRGCNPCEAIRASTPRHVPHDLCEILCILDERDVPVHPEAVETRRLFDTLREDQVINRQETTEWHRINAYLEQRSEVIVPVQIHDHLKAILEGGHPVLDMFSALISRQSRTIPKPTSVCALQGRYADTYGSNRIFLVEHLEHHDLCACTSLEECISKHRISSRQPSSSDGWKLDGVSSV